MMELLCYWKGKWISFEGISQPESINSRSFELPDYSRLSQWCANVDLIEKLLLYSSYSINLSKPLSIYCVFLYFGNYKRQVLIQQIKNPQETAFCSFYLHIVISLTSHIWQEWTLHMARISVHQICIIQVSLNPDGFQYD